MTYLPDDATSYITQWGILKNGRALWEQRWTEISELMDPLQAQFWGDGAYVNGTGSVGTSSNGLIQYGQGGVNRTAKIFDSTAPVALGRFAAVLESVLTPPGAIWHTLLPEGQDEYDPGSEGSRWLCEVNERIYQARQNPKANFASQQFMNYRSLGSVGTNCLYVDSAPGIPLRYRSIHMSEICISTNSQGMVDQVYRRFCLTARQAAQDYSKPGDNLPQVVKNLATIQPYAQIWFVHVVFPNPDVSWGKLGPAGMKWSSRTVCEMEPTIVRKGGYRTMPYIVSRYEVSAGEIYGRSAGDPILPAVKILNAAAKSQVRTWHRNDDPPWLTMDDAVMTPLRTMPGAINPGMVDENGKPKVLPLLTGGNYAYSQEMFDQYRGVVNDAFFVTLFQILVDTGQMTAREVTERAREKAMLIMPAMVRQQSECLGPLLERELDLMWEARLLPPPPQEIIESGGSYTIGYRSPLAMSADADQATAVLNTWGGLAQMAELAQIVPQAAEVFDNFDLDAMARKLGKGFNLEAEDFNTIEARDAIRQQRAQQQALQQAVAAAQPVSGAIKNVAQAQSLAQAQPAGNA